MAINYQRVNWDTTMYVNPENMNQMDEGIESACNGVDNLSISVDERIGDMSTLPHPDDDLSSNITAINSTLGEKTNCLPITYNAQDLPSGNSTKQISFELPSGATVVGASACMNGGAGNVFCSVSYIQNNSIWINFKNERGSTFSTPMLISIFYK